MRRRKELDRLAVVVGALITSLPFSAFAIPVISGVSLTIDKVGYNSDYVIGVRAYTTEPVDSVTASHTPLAGGSWGGWALASSSGTSWWNWSPSMPDFGLGSMDGAITVTATQGGESVTAIIDILPDYEMELPIFSVTQTAEGYRVSADDIEKADSYHLWLWDNTNRFYPFSQTTTSTKDFALIPTATLSRQSHYTIFVIANNWFFGTPTFPEWGSVYRSYDRLDFMYVPVPEPGTLALLGLGLAGLGLSRRRRAA